MLINTIAQGSYQTNSYVLRRNEHSKDCIVIDTGMVNTQLLAFLENKDLTPVALLLTHGHLDHIQGTTDLRKKYPDITVAIHKDDAQMLTNSEKNMSKLTEIFDLFETEPADILLEHGDKLNFASIELNVIHVPGHTPGGVCFYAESEKSIFVGDCIFAGSVGRTDFPGYAQAKCHNQLITGIKEKILTLDEETKLYCGHGPSTTLRCEKKHNPFLNGDIPERG